MLWRVQDCAARCFPAVLSIFTHGCLSKALCISLCFSPSCLESWKWAGKYRIFSPWHLPPYSNPAPCCRRYGEPQSSGMSLSDRPHCLAVTFARKTSRVASQQGPGWLTLELLLKLLLVCSRQKPQMRLCVRNKIPSFGKGGYQQPIPSYHHLCSDTNDGSCKWWNRSPFRTSLLKGLSMQD